MLEHLRVIAWETTRRCPLSCKHCRGASRDVCYDGELTTQECFTVLDSIALYAKPMIIFTGGEPMYRDDLVEIVSYAHQLGFRCVLAPCGLFASDERLQALKDAGIMMLSLSVDGPTSVEHDAFRGIEGAFAFVNDAMDAANRVGLPFQINTAVTKKTKPYLRTMRDFAKARGAHQIDYFFLVPVGRGKAIADIALSPEEAEEALLEIIALDNEGVLPTHVTCAPHIVRLSKTNPQISRVNGCMGGSSFVFISHIGQLQPCGFFDLPCGNLRENGFDFPKTYEESTIFKALRGGPTSGKCRVCEFRNTCRGCRARAFAESGDYLAQEPACGYIPKAFKS